ncbi:MAG: MFS transporter [Armatimonadota bacterium]|nr:MFS transporter [Armatimonadota bacterium]
MAPTATALSRPQSPAAAAAIAPLLIVLVAIETGVTFFGTLVPQIQQEFGVSAGTVALALSVYHAVRLVINVPAGRLIARSPLARMLGAGGAVLAVGAVLAALAPVFPAVLAGRVLMGAGSAVFFITTQFWISKVATPQTKARLFSYNQLAALTGSALGPALGGAVAGLLSWRYAMAITAVVGALAFLGAGALSDPSSRNSAGETSTPGATDRLHVGLVLGPGMIMMALFFFHGGVLSTLLPLLAARRFGLGPAGIGGILMLGTVWRAGAALVGGWLATWLGTRRVVTMSLALMAVTILGLHLADSTLGLVVVVSVMSWVNVGGSLVTALVTDLVPEAHWGTALGVNRTLADVGAMIAPLLVGFAIDRWDFSAAISLVAAFLFAVAVAATTLISPRHLHAART